MPSVVSRVVGGGDWLGWAGLQVQSLGLAAPEIYTLTLSDGTTLTIFGSALSGAGPGPTAGRITGVIWKNGNEELARLDGFAVDAAALAGWSAETVGAAFTAPAQGGIDLSGHEGADRLAGGGAGDTLSGGTGADTLVGGAGNDVFRYTAGDGSDLLGDKAIHGSNADGAGRAVETDTVVLAGADAYDLHGIAITQIDRFTVRDDAPVSLSFAAAQFGAGLVNPALVLDGVGGGPVSVAVSVDMATAGRFTAAGWTLGPGGGALRLQVTGSTGADAVVGSRFDDALDGFGGADAINGGAGDDRIVLVPGRAAGSVDGGSGTDHLLLDLSTFRTPVTFALLAPAAATRFGALAVKGIEAVRVLAGSGRDTLAGFEGADELHGAGGGDQLAGGGGGDRLDGGADGDDLKGEAGRDWLTGGDGADSLDGGTGLDTLDGGAGDDVLWSRNGEAVNTGGDNPFKLPTTTELLDGGEGVDTAVIDRSTALRGLALDLGDPGVLLDLGDGTALVNVERIVLRAGRGGDTVAGGVLADDIAGGDGRDALSGSDGNDSLDGGAGTDALDGGSGADGLSGGTGMDMLDGGEGDDRLAGGDGFDTLDGGWGNDQLSGDAGLDWLDGGSGNDTLRGGAGADTLAGGLGDDLYEVDGPWDRVFEEADEGRDTVRSTVDHALAAEVEELFLIGNAVEGGGNRGDNLLAGNGLANVLTGNGGNDTFLFGRAFGIDTVTDFSAGAGLGDRLLFDPSVFATREAAFGAARQVGTDVWVVKDANTRVVLSGLDLSSLHVDDFAVI